jgi:hypothetical protein
MVDAGPVYRSTETEGRHELWIPGLSTVKIRQKLQHNLQVPVSSGVDWTNFRADRIPGQILQSRTRLHEQTGRRLLWKHTRIQHYQTLRCDPSEELACESSLWQ